MAKVGRRRGNLEASIITLCAGYLRFLRSPDFLFPEKKNTTRAKKKSRPAKRTATNVSSIVDNDCPRRNALSLERNILALDSEPILALSAPSCPSFNVFWAARSSSYASVFLSSTGAIRSLFRWSAVSWISLVLLINALFKPFRTDVPPALIVTRPAAAGRSARVLDFGRPASLVVFAFNSHLLSGLVIPIHFFLALFLKQLVS